LLQAQSGPHLPHERSLPQHLPSELHLQSLHSHLGEQQQLFGWFFAAPVSPAKEATGAASSVMAASAIARFFNMVNLLIMVRG